MYTVRETPAKAGTFLLPARGKSMTGLTKSERACLFANRFSFTSKRKEPRLTATCPHCQVSQAFGAETTVNA